MAFNASTAWEVRTTGSDSNGGGFNTSSTGTDFSQQNSPQVSYTDLVIGATTTQLTSVTHPFVAADVGNIINITGGTGFTVQRVQINSVSGVTATCDKTVGTAASIGGTGNLGGGLATVPTAFTLAAVAGMVIWIKTGTYTLTASVSPSVNMAIIGYSITHGDNIQAATITTSTNGIVLISVPATQNFTLANLIFTNTASTKAIGINSNSNTASINMSNCSMDGFTTAVSFSVSAIVMLYGCSFTNNTAIGVFCGVTAGGIVIVDSCYFYANVTSGINVSYQTESVHITRSIFAGGGKGIDLSNATTTRLHGIITACTIADNSSDGITMPQTWGASSSPGSFLAIVSCILYGNLGFGVNCDATSPAQSLLRNNGVGSNTSGNYRAISSQNDATITATPFNGMTDFSLNGVAGGGAVCRGVGYPGAFPGGTTIGILDIGAVQSMGSGSVENYGFTG